MEKKSMGSFIAALRKAQGMTQRELAERLNVSDKSVSRWECGDGYPDLSMIPVIAEIFGVTSDELLRGERKSADLRNSEAGPSDEAIGAKGRKELERLKRVLVSSFRTVSFIAVGIALLALVVSAVLDLGFLRARLGFLFGFFFLLCASFLEAVFLNQTLSKLSGSQLEDSGAALRSIVQLSKAVFSVILDVFGFILPLFVLVPDTYYGLSGESWALYGALGAVAMEVVSLVVIHFIDGALVKRNVFDMDSEAKVKWEQRHKAKNVVALALVVVLVLTVILNVALTRLWGPNSVMEGRTFEDMDSFKEYIEMDIQGPYSVKKAGNVVYFDESGNEVSRDEAYTRTVVNEQGEEVLRYVHRNGNVMSISYDFGAGGSGLTIRAYTYDDLDAAQSLIARRNALFAIVYVLEVVLAVAAYFVWRGMWCRRREG